MTQSFKQFLKESPHFMDTKDKCIYGHDIDSLENKHHGFDYGGEMIPKDNPVRQKYPFFYTMFQGAHAMYCSDHNVLFMKDGHTPRPASTPEEVTELETIKKAMIDRARRDSKEPTDIHGQDAQKYSSMKIAK